MTENRKREEIMFGIFIIFLASFLGLLSKAAFAKDDATVPVISKIETAQKEILRERYLQRLQDAKQYLEKGDRYYANGKRLEALGEWSAAYALLDLLKDIDIDTAKEERVILEEEIKSRLEVDKTQSRITEEKRAKKMEETVGKILAEQEKGANAQKEERKQEPAKAVPSEKEVTAFKGNEGMISQSKIGEKSEITKRKEQKKIERQEQAKSRLLGKQQAEQIRQKESASTQEDEANKREIELKLSKEMVGKEQEKKVEERAQETPKPLESEQPKEISKDNEFKEQVEEQINNERNAEIKKGKVLKSLTEKREKEEIQELSNKQKEIDLKLKAFEEDKASNIETKEKINVRKADELGIKRASAPPRIQMDRFDIIDRMLKRFEMFYSEDY